MALRIPLTSDQTLSVEFHEIERRLHRLERRMGTGSGGLATTVRIVGDGSLPVNLQPILDRLDALEQAVANLDSPNDIPNFGAVGPTSVRGLVPAPGGAVPPTGVANHLLSETGEWDFPLRGLIGVATSGEQSEPAEDTVDVSGGLHVTGSLSASHVTTRDVIVLGYLKANGVIACSEYELSLAGLV